MMLIKEENMARVVHVALSVEDLDGARSFFEKVFGFSAVPTKNARENGLSMTDGEINVAVNRCRAGESPHINHFGVEVEDVDKFVAELRKHGYESLVEPGANKFRAPGGILIEIVPVGSKPGIRAR
jgi:catechol 2,3-dioxygenase-like lactoylglutathione lyase family enzyme